MTRILVVEDDPDIAALERDYLEAGGFEAEVASDGHVGLARAESGDFDLMILDVMLPGMDGFEVCRELRRSNGPAAPLPIMMVTARTEDIDQIRGLGLGADDYVCKPFSPSVLVAKVRARLASAERLGSQTSNLTQQIQAGRVTLDLASHRVSVDGSEVPLTNREFELLRFLLQRKGTVFSREAIYERVWGQEALGDSATVTVHINRLRDKLERDPAQPELILTVRGAGYMANPDL